MSSGLFSGVSSLALGAGLFHDTTGLWSGATGFIRGDGTPAGYTLYAEPTIDATGAVGVISQLYTNLGGTLTFSKVSGAASIKVASDGAVSTSTAIYDGDTVNFIARVEDSISEIAVEAPIEIIGSVVAPPATTLKPMETGNTRITGGVINGTGNQYTIHHVRGAATDMQLVLTGYLFSVGTGTAANSADYTARVAVEIPAGSGNWTSLTKSGNVAITVTAGTFVLTDPLSHTWADGDSFGLWVYATGTTVPLFSSGSGQANTALYTDENCSFTSVTTTPRSAITDDFTRRRRIAAVVGILGQKTADTTTCAIVGDSNHAVGTANLPANFTTSDHVVGPITRTVSQDYACINLGLGGNQASSFIYTSGGLAAYKQLANYADVIIDCLGTNESNNRGLTAALHLLYQQRWMPLWNGKRYIKATIPPRSTGTFATEAGQTAADATNIATMNTSIRGGLGVSAGVIELRNVVQGTDTNKWAANYSLDGLHYSNTGVTAIMATRAAMKAAIDAQTALLSATQPSIQPTNNSATFSGGQMVTGSISGSGLLTFAGNSYIEFRCTIPVGGNFFHALGLYGNFFTSGAFIVHQNNNGSGTQTTGTHDFRDGVERHYRVTRDNNGVMRLYVDGVLEITGPTTGNFLTIVDTFQLYSSLTGRSVRQLAAFRGLTVGNFTPPAPGYITDPANHPNLVAYWPLETDTTGYFGPVLPQ